MSAPKARAFLVTLLAFCWFWVALGQGHQEFKNIQFHCQGAQLTLEQYGSELRGSIHVLLRQEHALQHWAGGRPQGAEQLAQNEMISSE